MKLHICPFDRGVQHAFEGKVVLDVGAVYDPARNRFDHHQKEFTDVFGHGMLGDIFFRVCLGGKGNDRFAYQG